MEIELKDSPLRVSCRFTLCHPPSVDSFFLERTRELMTRLEMDVKICDDTPSNDAHPYSLDDFAKFSAVATDCIAVRRREWNANFGAESFAATTNEVYQRIILPRSEPVLENYANKH